MSGFERSTISIDLKPQAKIPPEGIHFALIEIGQWLEKIILCGRMRFFKLTSLE